MTTRFLYVIGEPGVGKSTLVRSALGPFLQELGREGAPFEVWAGRVNDCSLAYLGNPHDPVFPGTDRLSMSVAPAVITWLRHVNDGRYDVILGEGDRLTSVTLFHAVAGMGYDVVVVPCTSIHAADRREARRRTLPAGKAQHAAWVAGRVTKCANTARDAARIAGVTVTAELSLDNHDTALRNLLGLITPQSAPTSA